MATLHPTVAVAWSGPPGTGRVTSCAVQVNVASGTFRPGNGTTSSARQFGSHRRRHVQDAPAGHIRGRVRRILDAWLPAARSMASASAPGAIPTRYPRR